MKTAEEELKKAESTVDNKELANLYLGSIKT